MSRGTAWKKVLYQKQSVPDNYVDPSSFLSELQKNVNLRSYTWKETILAVGSVTQEISCTCMFVVVFYYLNMHYLSPFVLLSMVGGVTFMLYMVNIFTDDLFSLTWFLKRVLDDLKSVIVFLAFGYALSPVLKTLTETVSTDTIYAMVTVMMIAHIVFQDYGAEAAIVSSILSLNAAIFAAVCLASRLPSTEHAFALLTFAAGIFVLAPLFRRKIKEVSNKGQAGLTVIMTLLAIGAIYSISLKCAVIFFIIVFCINILCPAYFLHCQAYKENIYGPWDEAIIKEN